MTGKLITPEELAARWSVPRAHIYRLAREGRCPCVKLGRYTRFRLEDVEEFERTGGTREEAPA